MADESSKTLNARLMGALDCRVGDTQLKFIRNAESKSARLMLLMLCFADEGVSRDNIREYLYQDSEADFSNSLKALIFRLRKQLAAELGPCDGGYISAEGGVYRFTGSLRVVSDVSQFKSLCARADAEGDEDARMQLLHRAVQVHRGELLPTHSSESWVIYENALLNELFSAAVRRLCAWHTGRREYEQAHDYYRRALAYFPFDEEWAIGSINSLLSQGRYDEALAEYDDITSQLFDELGVYPSEQLLDCIRRISDRMSFSLSSAIDVNRSLADKPAGGAYYCSFPSFVDSYRIIKRIKGREDVPMTLVLFTVTDGNDRPLEDKNEVRTAISALRMAIGRTLRRSDMFTRYGRTQMLAMLWGMPAELVNLAIERIGTYLQEEQHGVCRASFQVLTSDESIMKGSVAMPGQKAAYRRKWQSL